MLPLRMMTMMMMMMSIWASAKSGQQEAEEEEEKIAPSEVNRRLADRKSETAKLSANNKPNQAHNGHEPSSWANTTRTKLTLARRTLVMRRATAS